MRADVLRKVRHRSSKGQPRRNCDTDFVAGTGSAVLRVASVSNPCDRGGGCFERGAKKGPAAPSQDAIRQGLLDLQKRGFNRLYQAGRIHEFSSPETLLDVDFSKPVYVLVDRLAVNAESRARLVDSIEICYREGQGEAILEFIADGSGIPRSG